MDKHTQGNPKGFSERSEQGSPKGLSERSEQGSPKGLSQSGAEGNPKGLSERSEQGNPKGFSQSGAEGSPKGLSEGSPKGLSEGSEQGTPMGVSTEACPAGKSWFSIIFYPVIIFFANLFAYLITVAIGLLFMLVGFIALHGATEDPQLITGINHVQRSPKSSILRDTPHWANQPGRPGGAAEGPGSGPAQPQGQGRRSRGLFI